MLVLKSVLSSPEDTSDSALKRAGGGGNWREIQEVLRDPKYLRRLIGCAGGWLCFDVCFFGVTIFLPHIMHSIVDKQDRGKEMLLLNSVISALINCLAIPAALLSIRLVIDQAMGRKKLQQLSFALIAVAYLVLFLFFPSLR